MCFMVASQVSQVDLAIEPEINVEHYTIDEKSYQLNGFIYGFFHSFNVVLSGEGMLDVFCRYKESDILSDLLFLHLSK